MTRGRLRAPNAAAWLAIAALILCLPHAALAADACAFPTPARVIDSQGDSGAKGSRLVQVWDVPDTAVYRSSAAPDSPAYAAFEAGVAQHVAVTDPVALLRASPGWDNPILQRNNALVADRAADWIVPAGCLEKLLVAAQQARVDLIERPTEFAALVLRSPDNRRLRVYYLTVNDDGIGRMTPLTAPVMADVKRGWKPIIALHNHSFHPGQPSLDGVLAPSEADAQFAANFGAEAGLQAAWITNGLHTSRIPASAFGLFTAAASGAKDR